MAQTREWQCITRSQLSKSKIYMKAPNSTHLKQILGWSSRKITHTHTHTQIYIYMIVCKQCPCPAKCHKLQLLVSAHLVGTYRFPSLWEGSSCLVITALSYTRAWNIRWHPLSNVWTQVPLSGTWPILIHICFTI